MKKLVILILLSLTLIGCSVIKNDEPLQGCQPYEAGTIYLYRFYDADSKRGLVHFYGMLIIEKDKLDDLIKFCKSNSFKDFYKEYQGKFNISNVSNKKLLMLNLGWTGMIKGNNSPLFNGFKNNVGEPYFYMYDLNNKNGKYLFESVSKEFLEKFNKKYNKKIPEYPQNQFLGLVSLDDEFKKLDKTKSITLGSTKFELTKMKKFRFTKSLFSPNIGNIVMLNDEKTKDDKDYYLPVNQVDIYPDHSIAKSLIFFVPSKRSKEKIWYDDNMFFEKDGKYYFKQKKAGEWW